MRLIQQLQPTALTNEENKNPVEENKNPVEENKNPVEENNQVIAEENRDPAEESKEELYSMEERIARMTSNLAEDERKQFSDMMRNEEQKTFVTFPMIRPSTVNLMDITPQTAQMATQLINGLNIGSNGLNIGSNNFMDSQTSQANQTSQVTQADLDNLANVPIQAFDQANSQLLNQVINQTFSQADSANVDSQVGQAASQVGQAASQVGQSNSQSASQSNSQVSRVGQSNSQGISQPNSINSIWRFNQVSQEEEKVIFRRPSVLYPPPSWNSAVNANASTLLSSAPPLVSQRYGIYPTGELGIPVPSESAANTCEAKAIVLACVLCSVNQIQTVNFPCMHACFCLECAKPAVANSKCCPICRINYMHVSMMYLQQKDATMKDLPVVGQKREREDDIVENIDDSVEIVMAKEVTAVDGTAADLEIKEPVNKRTRTE
jgi:hypothetical protein